MSSEQESCDVCVVGGGPGGSTLATLVAREGHRVVLIEKDTPPIYKIGESLLPSTIHGICALLGVKAEVEAAGFVRKLGGTFRWGRSPEPWTFAFAESPAFQGPTSHAYQVERMKFDAILLDNARRHGVDVRVGHRVVDAVIEDERVTGVDVVDASGRPSRIHCRYVADASGQGSGLARHCGERRYSTFFRNIAVFGYYHHGKRLPPPLAGNIFCAAFDKGWFWYIPLSAELTSVGAVIGQEHASLLRQDHAAVLGDLVGDCAPIRDLLTDARRVTDGPYGQVRVRKDYSYCHERFWRPGLVLVGDAACFIDPVFSSGVHLATYSALLAARSINTCLAQTIAEERAFGEFEARYRREYGYFHDFLTAFYDTHQDVDGYFWEARRVTRSGEPPRDAFIRLVGGSGAADIGSSPDRVGRARRDLERRMTASEATPAAGDAAVPRPANAGAQFWAELNTEGVRMQLRGAMAQAPLAETPLLPGGLVPSRDGLQWAEPRTASRTVSRTASRTSGAAPASSRRRTPQESGS